MPDEPSRRSQTDVIIAGFAGRIGAGKTSAAKYLSSKYGFQYARYSRILREWLLPEFPDRHRLREFGWEVMAGGRQAELNERLIAGLVRSQSAAIDGLRHGTDVGSLSAAFGASFSLIFLEADREVRFDRLRNKFASDRAVQAAESHAVESHIDTLRKLASAIIENNDSLESLHERLDSWLATHRTGDRE